jgi:nucleoside-diphosphate-sugar epimerase
VKGHYVVTGCAGFIGSHLTDRLLADGHRNVYQWVITEGSLAGLRTVAVSVPHDTEVVGDNAMLNGPYGAV